MERVTQLNSSEFSQFFEDTRNHKLNENQKNILLKLKEAVDMKEENLLTAEPNVLFQETELYQKALEMLNKMVKTFIQAGLIQDQNSSVDPTKAYSFPSTLPTFRRGKEKGESKGRNIDDAVDWCFAICEQLKGSKIPLQAWFQGIIHLMNPSVADWIKAQPCFAMEQMEGIQSETQWKLLFENPFLNEFDGLSSMIQRVGELLNSKVTKGGLDVPQ